MGHILLVDDHVFLLKALSILLSKEGFTFELAENGEQALERIREAQFDVIITDLDMPVMNGYEMIQNLRRTSNQVPPVIILSSLLTDNSNKSIGDIGAAAYLSKTESPLGILGTVRTILAQAS